MGPHARTEDQLVEQPAIGLTDEAHRSQYDTPALNMRAALPKAMFLAFTGTPLIAGEERTKEVFGDYVSIYDFQQSVLPAAGPLRQPVLDLGEADPRHGALQFRDVAVVGPVQLLLGR